MAQELNQQIQYISEEKLNKFKEEYENLVKVERPKVQEALKEARAQGDLSENAEYDAARERQSVVEGRISELENIINNSVVISNKNLATHHSRITIGTKVQFKELNTGEIHVIEIGGVLDSDPFENRISDQSPLAKALINKEVLEDYSNTAPILVEGQEKYEIKILKAWKDN
ncbi:transcription elongation factor GreA [Mycoplasma nasistruthionis]|uniref:Transcription elongation factor GreA n=1 Tax=Mycoplasma nasistruthionis TaxID=353852 RepID=A0A4Y6I6C7_9MOLU|nr:transcription elongation factor GreA [Mycoplasma nasistruthionis]QCZ36804.1 transcription elongation factor GreA [Mycoplasma nasistruthionis]QDF65083.1 transcription elongation factor GreA [Mycoplasma nasistruthionis]